MRDQGTVYSSGETKFDETITENIKNKSKNLVLQNCLYIFSAKFSAARFTQRHKNS